jgi:hypothetical protein
MAKMTRAEKRRRKIAKLVEIKLDGLGTPDDWRTMNYEELHRYHQFALREADVFTNYKYYGKGLIDQVLNHKAKELQRSIDREMIDELTKEK